jgi:hypothetical protein
VALLRQPSTQAHLPVTTARGRVGTYWLWDPSGATVVATLQDFASDAADGQVALLPLTFWHLLKVRDEASSQKLRGVSHEQGAALLRAAAEDRAQEKGKLRGRSAQAAETRLTTLLPAVKEFLPAAPARMATGIARLIEQAGRAGATFAALMEKVRADATREAGSSAKLAHRKSDLAAALWGLEALSVYDEEEVSVSAHMTAAAEFLKGQSAGGDLPRTNYVWFSLLADLPVRSWQTFWRATAARMTRKDEGDVAWLEFLKQWQELGLTDLPGQFAVMEGHPEGAKKKAWGGYDVEATAGASFTLQNGDDRFIVVENESYGDSDSHHFLRYSTADTPGNPPGYQVKNVRKIKAKPDPAQVAAFIAAAESCTAPPLPSRAELAEVAASLSTSPAEIGLIWLGGLNLDTYEHSFLPAELRHAQGLKAAAADAARQALRNLKSTVLPQLYEAVVAEGIAAPFAADRGPVLRSIAKTWQAKLPKRLPLDAALQKRLSAWARTSYWQGINHEELLAVAADPTHHPLLQPRDIDIRTDKRGNNLSLSLGARNKKDDDDAPGDSLRSIVQLVALVHAETPAGHPARAALPALIQQTSRWLEQPGTMLALRSFFLYGDNRKKVLTPTEWLNKHLGKTRPDAKERAARFDDGLIVAAAQDGPYQVFVAFRPAKLKDEGDMACVQGILALDIVGEDTIGGGLVALVAVIKGPGFQKLAKAILARDLTPGQWPQNPQHTAPAVVAAMRKKLKLGEDAAVLYAQLLALPDPTTANICAWNGWTAAQLKKVSAELVGRKLVLQATRARAGRSLFLPGEWAELKAPWLPVETWKLAHLVELDLKPRDPNPVGGPLVLRPFEDLFAAAWQRVLDGDVPRYEDVKRKKKAK